MENEMGYLVLGGFSASFTVFERLYNSVNYR